MKLYVIRHAQAESAFTGERCLSPKGEQQSMDIGAYFKAHSISADIVLTSPVLRARQTAEILCSTAELDAPTIEAWLSCGMSPEEAGNELRAYAELNTVVIVGHEPDLSFFLHKTLGDFPHAVKKASVSVIENYGTSPSLENYKRF